MAEAYVSKYPSTFYRVSLKAVIRDSDNRILAVKEYDSDTWNLPGGGWDHGETEKEALARELSEEVGYQGDFTYQLLKTMVFWLESRQAWLLWIVYDVKTENMDFRVGAYCSAVDFIHPEEFGDTRVGHWVAKNLV